MAGNEAGAASESESSAGSARLNLIGAALVLALLFTGGLVWQRHVASLPPAVAAWERGTVSVTPQETGAARLEIAGTAVGTDDQHCATVHYTGDTDVSVRLYGANYADADAGQVRLRIVSGSGPTCAAFGEESTVYDGTVGDFATRSTAYRTGVGAWQPSEGGEQSHPYAFTYEVISSTPQPTGVDFVWEARSGDPR
ncbi:hypothetical protein [Catenuloplanes japonicus]|uniref:hypothetical protein n=1 Tax=Catenuloplanes japonicus TaxID=33876 RepID=UPI0005263AE3|nr:hypothetical protein [Catenuloplanes japonicus]